MIPAQINPPYDASAPCPMCQQDLRAITATLHNAHGRLGSSCLIGKLDDLLRFHADPIELTVPHPATEALVNFHQEMIAILREGTTYPAPLRIQWSPETRPKIMAIEPRWREIMGKIELLSDAHFEDSRHSHGEPNILREKQGSKGDFWGNGNGGCYHYTVEAVGPAQGHIAHMVCGTEFRLHDHFLDRLRRDPAFYGKVWCPTCRIDAPWAQFAISQDLAA